MIQLYPTTTPDGAEAAEELVDLQHQISLLQLKSAACAARLAKSDYWDYAGSNSAIDWIRFNCHLTDKAAADLVAVGRTSSSLPESLQALEAGEIGYSHVVVMARTAEAVGKSFDEKKLLKLARELTPGRFYFKCQHYRHSLDAKGYGQEQADLVENRHLSLSAAEDGCLLINGVLDSGAAGPQDRCRRRTRPAQALCRRPGRAGPWRQAGQPPDHRLCGDGERPRGSRRGRDGVFAPGFCHRCSAHGL